MKRTTLLATVLASMLCATGATAVMASEGGAAPDQTTQVQIRKKLTAQGYEVRKINTEDGLYEAYALKDGKRFEIYFDAKLNVVSTKQSN
jgi:hypothetical protein